jgi:simple sugar transport system ATP-binding protein
MVGRDVLLRVEKPEHTAGAPLLEVRGLAARDDRGLPAVRDVSFEVRAGEIVGIAGIDANGQSELIEAIMGLRRPDAGTVLVGGKDITAFSPRNTLASGVSHIAEDRHRRGLVLEFSLAENISLREYRDPTMSRFGWLSPKKMTARARGLLKEFDVRGGDADTRAGSLSGGNQQKVVIARELSADPRVIIAAQPTRGLDVGAIEFVHRRLVEERDAGRAVLLVSLELEEIRSLSDRVLVIYEGEIVAELPPHSTEEDFGVAMTGGKVSVS